MSIPNDVVSPIDLRHVQDALQWAEEANIKRPSRAQFFQFYSDKLINPTSNHYSVLELASGPGFVAEALLQKHPHLNYIAVDFSDAMHDLAKQRLSHMTGLNIKFIRADFKQSDWYKILAPEKYDVIIIHQALHELRHKRYASDFHHVMINHLLKPKGCYAVCDHLAQPDGNMQNTELYMTRQEHIDALTQAGFAQIEATLYLEGLQLFVNRTSY